MTDKVKKKLQVKVPTKVVRNEEDYLSNAEFVLYTRLCFLYFRNFQDKKITLDHKKLMLFCKISDNRTFKTRMKKFYKLGLIEEEIPKLPTKGYLTIIFNEKVCSEDEHFTMLNADIFNYWMNDQIDEYAFRQVWYYKSHINLHDKERDRSFCFVAMDTLADRLRISKEYVHNANKQLKKLKLIQVVKHKLESTDMHNEADELIITKYNNHYYVADSLH
ncbi:hypothetical protein [Bacillus badius]|uniref:hypothetical protein n=1 Tax=Bacillus badius TaxID=1455 RepID=UPI00059712E7|nr:hypothetical protein [Bacillus badius]KIL74345.1 hypothetical protein SD78_1414 [Bacillus badius]